MEEVALNKSGEGGCGMEVGMSGHIVRQRLEALGSDVQTWHWEESTRRPGARRSCGSCLR